MTNTNTDTETITRLFRVDVRKEAEFLATIDQLNKRRKKCPITIVEKEDFSARVLYTLSFGIPYKVNGYQYLGLLSTKDGTPVFASEEGVQLFNSVSDKMDYKCSCCNKTITTRNLKFFFKNDKGEIVNFGKTCAMKFFSPEDIKELEKLTEICSNLESIGQEDEGFGGGGRYYDSYGWYDAVEWAVVQFFNHKQLYVSMAKAEFGKTPTIDTMRYILDPSMLDKKDMPEWKEKSKKFWDACTFDKEQMAVEVNKIRDYYLNREVKSDFDYNLKSVFDTRGSKYGVVLYGVYFYYKEMMQVEENASNPKIALEHFAGDNIENEKVVFDNVKYFEGQYGTTGIVSFSNEKHAFKWFTASEKLDFLVKGSEYIITKATVRKRDEYKGFKSNVIKTRFNWIKTVEV